MMLKLHPKAALTAGLLAGHGLRKRSLSLSGAIAALGLGSVSIQTYTPFLVC
jgi:hypothetical protein